MRCIYFFGTISAVAKTLLFLAFQGHMLCDKFKMPPSKKLGIIILVIVISNIDDYFVKGNYAMQNS